MKVFIVWSGWRSMRIAAGLREFVSEVVPGSTCFMSDADIEVGHLWERVLAEGLQAAHVGIVVLTPENHGSQWLNFEVGAISAAGAGGTILPYLIPPLLAVEGPLGRFQATAADQPGTIRLVTSLRNERSKRDRHSEQSSVSAIEMPWKKLERVIKAAMDGWKYISGTDVTSLLGRAREPLELTDIVNYLHGSKNITSLESTRQLVEELVLNGEVNAKYSPVPGSVRRYCLPAR